MQRHTQREKSDRGVRERERESEAETHREREGEGGERRMREE
jgi:hypothetical protein